MSEDVYKELRKVRCRCDEDDVPNQFFIITACNPDGRTVSDDENTRADEDLRQAIDKQYLPAFRVTGGNFDFSPPNPVGESAAASTRPGP